MFLNILHLPHRVDRKANFEKELAEQNISEFKIWEGIKDEQIIQRGISRGHKKIVMDAATKGLPEVCIMEDDCQFLDKGAFDYFIQNKPQEYLLYLGGLSNGRITSEGTLNDFRGLTLYIVSQKFYNAFLSVDERQHIDYALSRLGNIYHVCQPIVCTQMTGFSDNKQRYFSYKKLLKQYKTWKQPS